uniref:Uncharacterized protein n=1 Tax=Aegilops tauschii subsp. strangulata TaxID=200361 RepID=A0A453N3R7_AEGTS
EIKGHNHSFSSNRGLHHLFDHLLALKMIGPLLGKLATGTSFLTTELLTSDSRWHDKRLVIIIHFVGLVRGNGRSRRV